MFPLEGPVPPPSDHSPGAPAGAAADAIRLAEAALVRQNSVTAGVDLQVITAVLNAHAADSTGAAALDELQREIEAAVATRTDLDTPAGAREFQRYLIDKMHDIRAVVEDTDLDDTSKATLAAALASLYATSSPAGPPPVATPSADPPPPRATSPAPAAVRPGAQLSGGLGGDLGGPGAGMAGMDGGLPAGLDPGLIGAGLTDPGLIGAGPIAADPPTAPAAAAPMPSTGAAPAIPAVPSLGGLSPPPSLQGLSDLLNADRPDLDPRTEADADADDDAEAEAEDEAEAEAVNDPPAPPSLRPELAGVIAAAVAGTPIPDAFGQQGISIPAPGAAVNTPLDPAQVLAGDVGIFTDRHALALGNGKVLLDNQIQPIETVNRPGFIGWQHPPAPPPVEPAD